jgi:hypothetical protein
VDALLGDDDDPRDGCHSETAPVTSYIDEILRHAPHPGLVVVSVVAGIPPDLTYLPYEELLADPAMHQVLDGDAFVPSCSNTLGSATPPRRLVGWLSATDPDVVLMHFGTNDVWSNLPPSTILAAFTRMVGQMRASNPAMKILVAQIIPMNASNCADCAQRVVNLNAAIPAWAAGLSTATSPITVVDQFTGFVPATDTYDGVHPNDAGNAKIANRWYPALSAALG